MTKTPLFTSFRYELRVDRVDGHRDDHADLGPLLFFLPSSLPLVESTLSRILFPFEQRRFPFVSTNRFCFARRSVRHFNSIWSTGRVKHIRMTRLIYLIHHSFSLRRHSHHPCPHHSPVVDRHDSTPKIVCFKSCLFLRLFSLTCQRDSSAAVIPSHLLKYRKIIRSVASTPSVNWPITNTCKSSSLFVLLVKRSHHYTCSRKSSVGTRSKLDMCITFVPHPCSSSSRPVLDFELASFLFVRRLCPFTSRLLFARLCCTCALDLHVW